MAVTLVADPGNAGWPNYKRWSVAASADGDTTATIPHGMGARVLELVSVQILPRTTHARLSDWICTGIDAVNITLAKTTAAGSGFVGGQIDVIVQCPHTRIR